MLLGAVLAGMLIYYLLHCQIIIYTALLWGNHATITKKYMYIHLRKSVSQPSILSESYTREYCVLQKSLVTLHIANLLNKPKNVFLICFFVYISADYDIIKLQQTKNVI